MLFFETSTIKFPVTIEGIISGSVPFFLFELLQSQKCNSLVLFSNEDEAEEAFWVYREILHHHKISGLLSDIFPTNARSLSEESLELEQKRILYQLSSGHGKYTVFADIGSLSVQVQSPEAFTRQKIRVEKNSDLAQDFFCEYLLEAGYREVDIVYHPGEFSRRGALVDVFTESYARPLRIEWWGEKISDIREFEVEHQMSESALMHAEILTFRSHEEARNSSLLNFFLKDTDVMVISNPNAIAESLEASGNGRIFSELETFRNIVFLGSPLKSSMELNVRSYHVQPQPVFPKKFDALKKHLTDQKLKGYQNFFLSSNPRQYERLLAILSDISNDKEFHSPEALITFLPIQAREGFLAHDSKKGYYTDSLVFGKIYHREVADPLQGSRRKIILQSLAGLNPGDYVVHIDHGIGRYGGLEKINLNGKIQESIRLIYKNNDVLYVGVHQLHKISKYSGKDGTPPALDRLGSVQWEKVKLKAKRHIKELSYDLIKLYARRKASKGFAFQHDHYLEIELEASFEYEDTPDQVKVTREVKKDMCSPYPMDRLICGDVGFGKTEIAIRAAFKAAISGKQVAVLVPTTILAYQHYQTFSRRLNGSPCKVDFISRFKTAREIRKSLEDLKEGKTDIIIGTHRLLSKDVIFRDLGLLIIDEEQKFGVSAKDKIKLIKENIDTLTLTATPIPRTLQHSLMGSRDLSLLQTPPPNRLPVKTELIAFDEERMVQAIRFELGRGGQIYFIHHRVSDLSELAVRFKSYIPNLRISIAHGKMKADEIEKELLRFVEGKSDILFCTSIIENGIDISNANTIIINNAHFFGLSDLHQMRGRVGRSDRKAFCYLVVPSLHGLTSEASNRLKALVEFSDLGSGFQLALRDLDIRGAGNLLGAEQSGFIYEMGLETYLKILNQALEEIRREKPDVELPVPDSWNREDDITIETDLEARIPDTYVPNMQERMSLYQRLNRFTGEDDLLHMELEMKDRFGPLPKEVEDFMALIRFKKMAARWGFDKVLLKNRQFRGRIPGGEHRKAYFDSEYFTSILDYVQQHPQQCRLNFDERFVYLHVDFVPDFNSAYQLMLQLSQLMASSSV